MGFRIAAKNPAACVANPCTSYQIPQACCKISTPLKCANDSASPCYRDANDSKYWWILLSTTFFQTSWGGGMLQCPQPAPSVWIPNRHVCFHMLSILSWLDTYGTVYIPMILPVLDGLMKQGSARGQPRLGTDFRVRTDLWYPVCLYSESHGCKAL